MQTWTGWPINLASAHNVRFQVGERDAAAARALMLLHGGATEELEPPALRAERGSAEKWNRIHVWGSSDGKVGKAMDGIAEISAGCGELCR
jgi:hypothetical protein